MDFVKKFFNTSTPSKSDIDRLIQNEIREAYNLEYKGASIFNNREKLARPVSAFSNASGGLLIVGIEESSHKPVAIQWLDAQSQTRETLEQIIMSNVQPPLYELKIIPVYESTGSDDVIYLVNVPQSENPPHMSIPENRYYIRMNFHNRPMQHALVEALFEKRRNPILQPEFKLEWQDDESVKVNITLRNIGKRFAKYVLLRLYLPLNFDTDVQGFDLHPFRRSTMTDHRWGRTDIYGDFRIWNLIINDKIFHRDADINVGWFKLPLSFGQRINCYCSLFCEDTLPKIKCIVITGGRERNQISISNINNIPSTLTI